MNKQKILLKLDEIAEHPPGTLTGLESTADWSSMAWLELIALADDEFKKSIAFSQLTNTKTVDDIVFLLIG
jgi:acyl carrier protein